MSNYFQHLVHLKLVRRTFTASDHSAIKTANCNTVNTLWQYCTSLTFGQIYRSTKLSKQLSYTPLFSNNKVCLHFYFHHFERVGIIQTADTSSFNLSFSCFYVLLSCKTNVIGNHCLPSQNCPRSPGFCCHISHRPWCLQGPNHPCGRQVHPFLITRGTVHCSGRWLLRPWYQLYTVYMDIMTDWKRLGQIYSSLEQADNLLTVEW